MSNRLKAALAATAVATAVVSASAPAGIELVARGAIAGSALDKSGLTGSICSALPRTVFRKRRWAASGLRSPTPATTMPSSRSRTADRLTG